MKFHLIIPSAGSGSRFGSNIPKQYIKINNKEILLYSLEKFCKVKEIDTITIAVSIGYFSKIKNILLKLNTDIPVYIVEGGATRQLSVKRAFSSLKYERDDFVIIHDAARPFITTTKINELIKIAKQYGSALPCLKISDTIKMTKNNTIVKTIPRENLYTAQTPQIFSCEILKKSYEKHSNLDKIFTDESSIIEDSGFRVRLVEGEDSNIKITNKNDLKYFKTFI